MSGDIFQKPTPGRPFVPNARQFSAFIDAAVAAQQGKRPGAVGDILTPSPGVVYVKNNTGADLQRFDVVAFGAAVFSPADGPFFGKPILTGTVPGSEDEGAFCVLLSPLVDGAIGPAVAVGVVQVLVDDAEGDYAEIDSGETHFLTRKDSGARILWVDSTEAETGLYWAIIAIGAGGGGGGCTCPNIMELSTAGTVTGGSVTATFTVDGVTGSGASIAYNDSAATARTSIISANSSKLNTTNFTVLDGPWPLGALYLVFRDNLAETLISLPVLSNGLTGTNATVRARRMSAPEVP